MFYMRARVAGRGGSIEAILSHSPEFSPRLEEGVRDTGRTSPLRALEGQRLTRRHEISLGRQRVARERRQGLIDRSPMAGKGVVGPAARLLLHPG